MLSSIEYCTFANYSPRGQSELSKKSKLLMGAVKAGRLKFFEEQLIPKILSISKDNKKFADFFNEDTTLVPVPKSSILYEGSSWPTRLLAELMVKYGLGKEVKTLVMRTTTLPKSAKCYSADERPSVEMHVDSLTITPSELWRPNQITLIDDVLTLGRTSFACAKKLHRVFPDIPIRLFAVIRTRGFVPDIKKMIDLSFNQISYNPSSGKTIRYP